MKFRKAAGTAWNKYWTMRRIVGTVILGILVPFFAVSVIYTTAKSTAKKAHCEKLEKTYTATVEGKLECVNSRIERSIAWFPTSETVSSATVSYTVGKMEYTYEMNDQLNGIIDPPIVHYDPKDPSKCFVESEKENAEELMDFVPFRILMLVTSACGLIYNLKIGF